MSVPSAPDYDNVRWAGKQTPRIPTEIGACTLAIKQLKAIDRGAGSASITISLVPYSRDTFGAAEASYIEVDNVGSGTGATILEIPGVFPGHYYVVDNNTGQGKTVTLRVKGQTGIAVVDGARAFLVCDSTDIQRVSADYSGNGSISAGPAPITAGSSVVLTTANAGGTILLGTVGGSKATLPAATGSGTKYRFIVTGTTTSGAHKILPASIADFIQGIANGSTVTTGAVIGFSSGNATNHSIQMPFAGSQPSGGFIGDIFDFTDIATNLWQCSGTYQSGTTPTTPFSAATT